MATPLATCSRGSVQQGLAAAGGALGFYPLGLATDKRYSLGTTADYGLGRSSTVRCAGSGSRSAALFAVLHLVPVARGQAKTEWPCRRPDNRRWSVLLRRHGRRAICWLRDRDARSSILARCAGKNTVWRLWLRSSHSYRGKRPRTTTCSAWRTALGGSLIRTLAGSAAVTNG